MNFLIKNSLIVSKTIKQIIIRDLYKSPITNYFGDTHQKHVLISYITKPFRKGIDITHTNTAEALEIAKIFRSLKFNVDIADYDYEGYLDYNKYDVIFGFGEPLIKSFNYYNKRKIRIYYGTGAHISVQNNNSLKRIEEVYNKKNKWLLESGRVVKNAWSPQTNIVNAMIVLGNSFVKESYERYFDKKIYLVPPSFYKFYDFKEIIGQKNFSEARKNFLWFGGNGLIHKGLDLVLDLFKDMPNLNLHVCGAIDDENGFKNAYYNELYNTPNIHTHNFVKINTSLFKELLKKCASLIYPSCSEGGGAAVLNVLGNGALIPVLSKESSIDVNDFGFIIDPLNSEEIRNSVNECLKLNESEIKTKSLLCGNTIAEKNSLENFSKNFNESMQSILKDYEL